MASRRRIWWECRGLYVHPELTTGVERVTRELGSAIGAACSSDQFRFSFHPCVSDPSGHVFELEEIPGVGSRGRFLSTTPATIAPPDIYIVADSTWDQKILQKTTVRWREGVVNAMIMHDLIPIEHPDSTTQSMVEAFNS